MSLSVAKEALFVLRHVSVASGGDVAFNAKECSRNHLKALFARRFCGSQATLSSLSGKRAYFSENRTSRRISSISGVYGSSLASKRLVATNVETYRLGEEIPLPSNHEQYHCGHCNYTSKMPIFICNACHSLDPKGGEHDPLAHVHAHPSHGKAKSAGEALEELQTNLLAKCQKHDALPCPVCEPFATQVNDANGDTPHTPRTCDYFDFFSCPHKFNMDAAQMKHLTNRYRELQRVLHPDVYSAKDGTTDADLHAVQQQSAALADAYRTLRNPYQRAIYLLGLHGIDVNKLNESQYEHMLDGSASATSNHAIFRPNLAQLKAQEQAMLMHVMEVRETLDESEDKEEVKDILVAASAQVEQCLRAMEAAFEKKDLFDARHRTVLLNYLSKIQQEAEGKLEGLNANFKKDAL